MSDEDNNMALNDEVENVDTTPVSEATEEVEDQPDESANESELESEAETGEESKKGYSQRVRELNSRAKQAEEKVKSLSDKIAELTGSSPDYEPYTPQVQPGAEITPEQYQSDVARTANSIVDLKLKQQQVIGKIQSDTVEAVRKNPELDPESENFNQDLSQSVTTAVEAYVRSNPYQADVKSFVDQLLKPYKKAVTKEVGQASENLAKQVSQSALRPNSVRSQEKPAGEKSIAELEKELGVVY